MDCLTFIAEMAKALAWPAVVACGLGMFGQELVTLLKQITTLKFGNVEVSRQIQSAGQDLTVAEARAAAPAAAAVIHPQSTATGAPPEPAESSDQPERERPGMELPSLPQITFAAVEGEPVASMLQAWEHVETAIKFAVERSGGGSVRPQWPGTALTHLLMKGVIDRSTMHAISSLRAVRSKIARGQTTVTVSEAEAFVENASRLVSLLLHGKQPLGDS